MNTNTNTTQSGRGLALVYHNNKKTQSTDLRVLAVTDSKFKAINNQLKKIMHLRLNYQSVHIQYPMNLVKKRHKLSEKNRTVCNAKIQVSTDCRFVNVYMYITIIFSLLLNLLITKSIVIPIKTIFNDLITVWNW